MKIIYLVRHGQTQNNVKKVTGGASDTLSVLGELQASLIAERFRELKIEAVISSTYTRAQQTANAIAGIKSVPVESSELFIEVKCPSILFSKSQADSSVADLYVKRSQLWGVRDEHIDDEENFYDADVRACQALAFLVEHPASRIVVASHGAFIKSIIENILLGDLLTTELTTRMYEKFAIGNTGVTVLKYDKGTWKLVRVNDTLHLDPEHESY